MEGMERDKITKRDYVGECTSRCSVGRPRKRWIDTAKECLKKTGMSSKQRRMVQDRSEWLVFVRGNGWGVARGMNT